MVSLSWGRVESLTESKPAPKPTPEPTPKPVLSYRHDKRRLVIERREAPSQLGMYWEGATRGVVTAAWVRVRAGVRVRPWRITQRQMRMVQRLEAHGGGGTSPARRQHSGIWQGMHGGIWQGMPSSVSPDPKPKPKPNNNNNISTQPKPKSRA